jgi:hypothetical protein
MEIVLSDRAIESLSDAPTNVLRAFEKQLRFLAANLQHPSLHAKKYNEGREPVAGSREQGLALLLHDQGRHVFD